MYFYFSVFITVIVCNYSHAQSVPSYVPLNGLAAWYSFSGNANDSSGNGHHGNVNNAVSCADRFSQPASAYYFGGSNQQITCTNDTSVTNHKDFSVSMWFNVEYRSSGWQQNVMISNIGVFNSSGGFEIFTSNPPNADITGMFRNTTFADQQLQTTGLVNIDSMQWYHVVYTIEYYPAEDSTRASIFLNGSLIKTQKYFHSIVYSGITPLIIGTNIDSIGWQRNFKGKTDDIGLWNRVLTQQEITDLYYGPTAGIREATIENQLSIYPNPAKDFVSVSLSSTAGGNTEITVYDLLGNAVKTFSSAMKADTRFEQTFSVAGLPAGIYPVRITSGKKQCIGKIVKQ
jgi:hypothetical protein